MLLFTKIQRLIYIPIGFILGGFISGGYVFTYHSDFPPVNLMLTGIEKAKELLIKGAYKSIDKEVPPEKIETTTKIKGKKKKKRLKKKISKKIKELPRRISDRLDIPESTTTENE